MCNLFCDLWFLPLNFLCFLMFSVSPWTQAQAAPHPKRRMKCRFLRPVFGELGVRALASLGVDGPWAHALWPLWSLHMPHSPLPYDPYDPFIQEWQWTSSGGPARSNRSRGSPSISCGVLSSWLCPWPSCGPSATLPKLVCFKAYFERGVHVCACSHQLLQNARDCWAAWARTCSTGWSWSRGPGSENHVAYCLASEAIRLITHRESAPLG